VERVSPAFEVGQTVVLRDANRKADPIWGTVVKVGRIRVTVNTGGYLDEQYRMDDGSSCDGYGHSWIQTEQQYADEQERAVLWDEIKTAGFQRHYAAKEPDVTLLRAVAQAIREVSHG
jgi:hypothetical protein